MQLLNNIGTIITVIVILELSVVYIRTICGVIILYPQGNC